MEEASSRRRKPRPPPPSPGTVDAVPPEVLEQVLSFLPLRDAVRTSAVCRAWRRLWESAPGLALEWDPDTDTDTDVADGVLSRYSGPVRSFVFDLRQGSFWRADDWLPLLAAKGVQTLMLHFIRDRVSPSRYYMDASIFSCRELTSLDLSGGCQILAAPSGLAGFPKLTRLCLRKVGFPHNGMSGLEAMIAESPMLEVLFLDRVGNPDEDEDEDEVEEWVIQAPNLRYLTMYSEHDNGWQIEGLPSIEEVEIMTEGDVHNRDLVKLLTGLARVRKLKLEIPIGDVNALEGLSCSFENLKDLSLVTTFFTSAILCELCLLKNAPNLEKLTFVNFSCHADEVEVGVDLLNGQWIEGLLASLKSFTIDQAICQRNEMHFIEFVLSKAARLQELHIVVSYYCPKSSEELLEEISMYTKASPQAKLFISKAPM